MTCEDFEDESRVVRAGNASPEMRRRVEYHFAICVSCGGVVPDYDTLVRIFRDMFAHVGHAEVCQAGDCKCSDDPPSHFEVQVVKQFKRGGGI